MVADEGMKCILACVFFAGVDALGVTPVAIDHSLAVAREFVVVPVVVAMNGERRHRCSLPKWAAQDVPFAACAIFDDPAAGIMGVVVFRFGAHGASRLRAATRGRANASRDFLWHSLALELGDGVRQIGDVAKEEQFAVAAMGIGWSPRFVAR